MTTMYTDAMPPISISILAWNVLQRAYTAKFVTSWPRNEWTNERESVCEWGALIRFKVNVHLSWSKGLCFFGDSVDGLKLYRCMNLVYLLSIKKEFSSFFTWLLHCIVLLPTVQEWVKLEFLQLKVIWERNSLE